MSSPVYCDHPAARRIVRRRLAVGESCRAGNELSGTWRRCAGAPVRRCAGAPVRRWSEYYSEPPSSRFTSS
jgi:hypothetical protein